jgi:23S rRNA (cytosine1962-C5)-methyltransferase
LHFDQPNWPDYQLLDSGDGAKLERLGSHTIVREEPMVCHPRTLSRETWDAADTIYLDEKGWRHRPGTPETWTINFGPLTLTVRPAPGFKHIGIFPEQAPQWQWMLNQTRPDTATPTKLLNLFGHTGAATLAAAHAGFIVTHVDSSRPAISHARENQVLSNLGDAPIRWIQEDVSKFIEREIKRGNRYDAILLDPPAFGRGPKGQIWQIERDLPDILPRLQKLLTDQYRFLFLNLYAGGLSIDSVKPLLQHHGNLKHGSFKLEAKNGPDLHMADWLCLQ